MEGEAMTIDPTYRGNIWSTPQERMDWRVYLTELSDDPKNHIEAVDMIREANEEDTIEILITCPGGRIDIADMYIAAMADSKAKIITRATGECCSAATSVFLEGDERVCDNGSYFMFHNVQFGGIGGDSANVYARTKFYERLFKEKFYNQMSEVLTEDELAELFERAGEVYLTADEMRGRLMNADNASADVSTLLGDLAKASTETLTNELVAMPFPTTPIPAASSFPEDDSFKITLDCGYAKTFFIGRLDPKDFDEYNMEEIEEIGFLFNVDRKSVV